MKTKLSTGIVVSIQDFFPDGNRINIQEGAANVQFPGEISMKIEIPVWATGYQINQGMQTTDSMDCGPTRLRMNPKYYGKS